MVPNCTTTPKMNDFDVLVDFEVLVDFDDFRDLGSISPTPSSGST